MRVNETVAASFRAALGSDPDQWLSFFFFFPVSCLCWFQLDHLKLHLPKNLITKLFGCRDCLAGSLRSQPSVTCCGFLLKRSPCFFLCLGVASIYGKGSKWCLFVCADVSLANVLFFTHVSSVLFTWILFWAWYFSAFTLRNVYRVSSSDLLWGTGNIFTPSVQWKTSQEQD